MLGKRGIGLVDTLVALVLLGISGLVFTATFPSGFGAVRQSSETKKAVAIAQQKLEQVKALGYESLSYANLRAANVIDEAPSSSPFSFSSTENLANALGSATGTLYISDYAGGVKVATVDIIWKSGGTTSDGDSVQHRVTLQTLITDVRPWRMP